MTYKECSLNLRKLIKHRERMHQVGVYEMTPEGAKLAGKINPDADLEYQVMLVALECVDRLLEIYEREDV